MVDLTVKCPDGWDPSELLAFLEGDLPPEIRRELEQHLSLCRACSSELESLRRLDAMLKACPQCFHPDEEDLFRFVSSAEAAQGRVSVHVEACEDCQEAIAVLREMVAIGPRTSKPSQRMPQPLLRRLEARHPALRSPDERSSRFAWAQEWLRRPFGMPMLAVGTVAAVLVVVALLIPFWTQLKDVPWPEGVAPLEQGPTSAADQIDRPPDSRPPEGDYATQPSGPPATVESPLPAPKLAPGAPAVLPPAPRARPPALGKGEPLKLKEDFREAPVSRPRAASPSAKAYRVPPGSDSEGKVRSQVQAPPKEEGAGRRSGQLQTEPTGKQRPRVAVHIIPPAGQELPGLRFVPPKEIESKYLFAEEIGTGKERAEKKRLRGLAVTSPEKEGYTVIVQIRQSGPMYSLDGTISGPGLAEAREKRLSKSDVATENLQAAITAMVVSLLQGGEVEAGN